MSEQTISHPHHAALHHDPQAAQNAIAAMEEAELRALKARQAWQSRAFLAGRVLIGGMFLTGAMAKLLTWGQTKAAMADFGLELTSVLLTAAVGIEAICGALLLAGYKTRGAALTLAAWLGVVTLVIYGNLTIEANRGYALANAAIAGGLLMLFAHGAGNHSVDKVLAQKAARE